MDFLRDSEDHGYACSLLAIHSAISYADALRAGLGDDTLHADDHRNALVALKRLLSERRLADRTGFDHFEYLLSMKSFVAYGGKRLDRKRRQEIATRAERFANWVSKVARGLNVEGWTHDEN
jgi:hypothetical protein